MRRNKIKYLIHCALIITLIILSAFIKIPFPLVPLTMQTFIVILCALILGPGKTVVALSLYILMGLIGLPVFASGGGFAYALKPSFGYLIGMIPAAYAAGVIAKKNIRKKFMLYLLASVIATLIIYIIGVPYLYYISNHVLMLNKEFAAILYSGFLITLPGDMLKATVASIAAKKIPPID